MESSSPQHTDRKQQSAQHEKKATQFLQANVYSTASIFSGQSAIEHMMKHLQRRWKSTWKQLHTSTTGTGIQFCFFVFFNRDFQINGYFDEKHDQNIEPSPLHSNLRLVYMCFYKKDLLKGEKKLGIFQF